MNDSERVDNTSFEQHVSYEVLGDLENLKIKSNTGRPRKPLLNKENKLFKVPTSIRRKKSKFSNVGLKYFHDKGQILDEANAILDTGMHMGKEY